MRTAAYMSPEQARGLAVDKRTDIWAFRCALYEMLTGRVTFAGETISDTMAKILEREPDWSTLPAATPAPNRRLLLRCLADVVDERPVGAGIPAARFNYEQDPPTRQAAEPCDDELVRHHA